MSSSPLDVLKWNYTAKTLALAYGATTLVWGAWLLTFGVLTVDGKLVLVRDTQTTWGLLCVVLGATQAGLSFATPAYRVMAAILLLTWWTFAACCFIASNPHSTGVPIYSCQAVAQLSILIVEASLFRACVRRSGRARDAD